MSKDRIPTSNVVFRYKLKGGGLYKLLGIWEENCPGCPLESRCDQSGPLEPRVVISGVLTEGVRANDEEIAGVVSQANCKDHVVNPYQTAAKRK